MKKLICFIPAGFQSLVYLFLLFVMGGWEEAENWLGAVVYAAPLFVSGFLLAKGKWYGGIPGMMLGGYFVLSYLHRPWPVNSPLNWQIGTVYIVYYLALAALTAVKTARLSSHKHAP